jgi:positive regulator of sigma E activity
MREEGEVIALLDGTARVRLSRKSACSGCRACASLGPGAMVVEARNFAGAGVGERVCLEITGPDPLRAALLVYGAPLAGLIAGCIAGTALTGSETAGLGIGLAALACVYGALRRYDRHAVRSGKAASTVVQRIPDGGKSGNDT